MTVICQDIVYLRILQNRPKKKNELIPSGTSDCLNSFGDTRFLELISVSSLFFFSVFRKTIIILQTSLTELELELRLVTKVWFADEVIYG